MEKKGIRFIILRAVARQLQKWADFAFKQIGQEERASQRDLADGERTGAESAADADNPPSHWLAQVNAGGPPAHWLARVRKDAPDLLQQPRPSNRNPATQSYKLPTAQLYGNTPMADAEANLGAQTADAEANLGAQTADVRNRQDIQMHSGVEASEKQSNRHSRSVGALMSFFKKTALERPRAREANAGHGEESRVRREETDVFTSSNVTIMRDAVQEKEPPKEVDSVQLAEQDLWPPMSIPLFAYDRQIPDPDAVGGQLRAEMRWPSLPEGAMPDNQDWEMTWRVWERRHRLDEEQRGTSWNV